MFLEIGREHQQIINDFMATGDMNVLEQRLNNILRSGAVNDYQLEQIKIARENDIKVVCMNMENDPKNDRRERDSVMTETVKETLAKDPRARILIQVGADHGLALRSQPLDSDRTTIADPLSHRLQQEGIKTATIELEDSDLLGSYAAGDHYYGKQKFFKPLLQYENTVVPLPKNGPESNIMRLFYFAKNPRNASTDAKMFFKESGNTVR